MKKLFLLVLFVNSIGFTPCFSTNQLDNIIKKTINILNQLAEKISSITASSTPENEQLFPEYQIILSGQEAKRVAAWCNYDLDQIEELNKILGNSVYHFRPRSSQSSSHVFIAKPSRDNYPLFINFLKDLTHYRTQKKLSRL